VSELEERIRTLAAGSLSLAVARYLHDAPEARDRPNPVWLDAEVERWSARPAEELAAEAEHRLEVLDEWEREAPAADPELWEERRIDALHARTNLQSAASGSFGTAAGALVDFLREVGAEPDALGFF
jgi:hypothetical protein